MPKKKGNRKNVLLVSLIVAILSVGLYFQSDLMNIGAQASSSTSTCDNEPMDEDAYNLELAQLDKTMDELGVALGNERDNKKRDALTKQWNFQAKKIALLQADWMHGKIEPGKDRLFTEEVVNQFNGTDESLPIYLVVVGEVFDVTRGKHFYGEEGGYHAFAGKDGSRAFITGEFNDDGSIPDVEGLTPSQVQGIEGWREFYHNDYTYLGKLIGWYYDKDGNPTKYKLLYLEKLKLAQEQKNTQEKLDKIYPGCNSKWSQEGGGEVWCSQKSGGVERAWIGVPRLWIPKKPDGSNGAKKCVCINLDTLPPPRKSPAGDEVYDLEADLPIVLEIYKACINTPKAHHCKTS